MRIVISPSSGLAAIVARGIATEVEPSKFVGRVADLAALHARVLSSRLVSVIGAGGIGKSPLVRRWSIVHRSSAPGSIWFCDLRDVEDIDALRRAVLAALGAMPSGGDLAATLDRALAGNGRGVLVLDDVDGIDELEASIPRWLAAAPGLRILLTARAPLAV